MTDIETVLTRDRTSGVVHKRIRLEGENGLRTHEACNLDDAGAYDVIDSTENVEPDKLCRRCFPLEVRA